MEAAIEFSQKRLFDTIFGNHKIAKFNPFNEHATRLNEVYTKRYELDNEGFFATQEEGDSWELKKMAEFNKILRAPSHNKIIDWKPALKFKTGLTML